MKEFKKSKHGHGLTFWITWCRDSPLIGIWDNKIVSTDRKYNSPRYQAVGYSTCLPSLRKTQTSVTISLELLGMNDANTYKGIYLGILAVEFVFDALRFWIRPKPHFYNLHSSLG